MDERNQHTIQIKFQKYIESNYLSSSMRNKFLCNAAYFMETKTFYSNVVPSIGVVPAYILGYYGTYFFFFPSNRYEIYVIY